LTPPVRSGGEALIDQFAKKRDVNIDDWDTEVLTESAASQLASLAEWLERGEDIDARRLNSLVTDRVECTSLYPKSLVEIFRHGPIAVRRPDSRPDTTASKFAGESGFVHAFHDLSSALGQSGDRCVKFKLFRIDKQEDDFSTQVRYEASIHRGTGSRQHTAVWLCRWTYPRSAAEAPLLVDIAIQDFEESEIAILGGHLLVDCTESALGHNPIYSQQVLPGINHWLTRIPREFMGMFGHHGIAVGDVNGDDRDDLYVCEGGGLPNRLYVQQPDGTATDVSAQAGVDLLDDSTGALLIDLDNDGDQDLVVGTDPTVQIAENDGHARFTWRASLDVDTDSLSLCAADYDIDGDLDIYICGYNVRRQDPTNRGLPFPLPYHDARNGGRNVLLRNEGDFRFVDITQEAGLDVDNSRFSMAAAWEDFDNDGDLDLYVANDFGRNNLYRNDGGHFHDIAAEAGVEDHGSGMSVSWGDCNRDGQMDLYVGNMFSAAGNRVTYQRRFAAGIADETVSHLRRMARGNTLFLNSVDPRDPRFVDASEPAAVWMGRWAWGSKFVDLTNDGWLVLVVANGYVTGDDDDDL
jgi:hypothetical protein